MKRLLPILAFLFTASIVAADDLSVARAALRDGLWSIARRHLAADNSDTARLIMLESYAREGKWKDLERELSTLDDRHGLGFDYYRAVTNGDVKAAIALLRQPGAESGFVDAQMLEADLELGQGHRATAERIWREVIARTNAAPFALAVAGANLGDEEALRRAVASAPSVSSRRFAGLRLGRVLLRNPQKRAEGERLISSIVRDAPDTPGAREAFLDIADTHAASDNWEMTATTLNDLVEIWPEEAQVARTQEGRGWALFKQGRYEESLVAFQRAESCATNDAEKAQAVVRQGDALSALNRLDEAMRKYTHAMERYPKAEASSRLKALMDVRRLEESGREAYRACRFVDARNIFARVAAADASRGAAMAFLDVQCLYGLGQEKEAEAAARRLTTESLDPRVRARAHLWLAKLSYNHERWREAGKFFLDYADAFPEDAEAPEALLWSARAAIAENDFNAAIQRTTRLVEKFPASSCRSAALLLQGEALSELARFDEAVLILDGVSLVENVTEDDRMRALLLKADALFAMGADNAARYQSALEVYRSIRFGGALNASGRLSVAFKIGRTLEKLKRLDEAIDQYYTEVVLAYREGRMRGEHYDDVSKAAFSRAAFRLADEYESRGRDLQAINILELVAGSDVPAAVEARKRIARIREGGKFQ